MGKASKEPCKKEACDIQACLTKNNFNSQRLGWIRSMKSSHTSTAVCGSSRCHEVIQLLQSCCENCEYKSTHCGSMSGLLRQITKQGA
ncbi:Mature-T-Cell Proliferation I type [Dillenia turbinata]|uniref:Mature-T-Cell Proliferation I type n=1 Tax=Dillenia turbinata TaxID=194707 RepID=A0AAN8UU51_9MAGN